MPPNLELSMIVKNGEHTLERCLMSAASFVDRILIGDTGSTDNTIALAESLGAEVIHINWQQDFAAARNQVLAQARCDWILILDADEMLDTQAPMQIRRLIARKDIDAYDVTVWNYVRSGHMRGGEEPALPNPAIVEQSRPYPAYNRSRNVRLFRRRPDVYFEHCVHETVIDRIEALNLRRAAADFVIHHFGYAEDAIDLRESKNETYHQLGQKKLQTEPNDARAWFEAGLSELELRKNPAAALPHFTRATELNPRDARAWLFTGICLVRAGQLEASLKNFQRAIDLGLRSPVLFESIGDAYFHADNYVIAREAYAQAEAAGGISPLNSAKLGACLVHLGEKEQGIARMKRAVDENKDFAELYDILVAGAMLAGDLALAAKTAQARLAIGKPEPIHHQIAAELESALVNATAK